MEGRLLPTRTATMCTTRRNGCPTPAKDDGYTPHGREAEYTAALAFAIAVSVIWWAARRGLAKTHSSSNASFHSSRPAGTEHYMSGYGPHGPDLGADSSIARVYDGVCRSASKLLMSWWPRTLFKMVHYMLVEAVFHHRLSTTNWKSVWASGHNCCDAGEWLAKYIIHIRTSNLWDALPELAYKTLACDCGLQDHCLWLCHGPDVRERTSSSGSTLMQWPQMLNRNADVVTASGLAQSHYIPRGMSLPVMSQEALVLAFCKAFPASWFTNFKFAMVEGPHQQPPILLLPTLGWGRWSLTWLQALSDRWWLSGGSHDPPCAIAALQPGTRWALPASIATSTATPALRGHPCDLDLQFAVAGYDETTEPLRPWRQRAIGAHWPLGTLKSVSIAGWGRPSVYSTGIPSLGLKTAPRVSSM